MDSSRNGAAPPGTGSVRPSFTQVAASALAAVSAAVVSSTFGVAGTLIGAAIASVIASVGSTLYLASIRSTNERLRRLSARQSRELEVEVEREQGARRSLGRIWLAAAVLTVAVFGIAFAVITTVEASTGKSVTALVHGVPEPAKPVPPASTASPAPTVTPTPKPTATPKPTVTPSASPSAGQSPSPAPSASVTPSPSPPAVTPADPSPPAASSNGTPATAP